MGIDDVPQIKESEKTENLVIEFEEHLASSKSDSDEVTVWDIYSALFKTLQGEFIFVFVIYVINIASKLGVSVVLQKLFESVARQENVSEMYLLAFASISLLFTDSIIRHNCFYEGPKISGCVRSCLISLMFKRVCSLTQYTANKEELGKLTNLLSNDFNLIEVKAPFFFGFITVPFGFGGIIALLYWRLGAEGLISLAIPFAMMPISLWISKLNGSLLQEVNVNKDRRVKITSELIEAIKHIKIYGWEMAFRKIIGTIREK